MAAETQVVLGAAIQRSQWAPLAHVIGEVTFSPSGNTVLRVGIENEPHGSWHQSLHVVLTEDETRELVRRVLAPPHKDDALFIWTDDVQEAVDLVTKLHYAAEHSMGDGVAEAFEILAGHAAKAAADIRDRVR